jgi:hypothetical protein
MLELAKPETRSAARTHPEKFTWGIVDIILALVMLPFGLWTLLIEAIVNFAAGLVDFDARASRLIAFRSEGRRGG